MDTFLANLSDRGMIIKAILLWHTIWIFHPEGNSPFGRPIDRLKNTQQKIIRMNP